MRHPSTILPVGPVLFLFGCAGQDPSAAPDSAAQDSGAAEVGGWAAEVGSRIATAERDFIPTETGFSAYNRAWSIDVRLDASGALLRGPAEEIGLRFEAWGREGDTQMVPAARPEQGDCTAEILPDGACKRRVELDRGDAVEWWSNRSDGVQQAWDLVERPEGDGPVLLEVVVEGASAALDGERVLLLGDNGGLWSYDGLVAWDAIGEPLEAWFEVSGDTIEIRVDDAGAEWPITVDPVTSTAAVTWTGSSLAMTLGAALGGGGNVNGDGYDDVVIGAPAYDAGAGVVYVYYGSATGPSTTADVALSAPSAAAAFGTSVDIAGDVNADGYDDVIVGAPYESTTASSAGRAYVYHGSSAGLSSTVATTLTGSGTANSYFGFAVSAAGDVNKDSYDDVIVGEHGYSSSTGRAWIYGGSSAGVSTSTYQTLNGAATGVRFGYAVTGGDTNGDGYSDLAVGSPYYTTSSLAGRVSHYKGSSAIFSTVPSGTTLSGTTAYQYGTSISLKGSFNGDTYADLFVGAPTGSSTGTGRLYYYQSTSSGIPTGQTGRIDGPGGSSYFTARVTYAGDVNADGYDDLLVGAPYYSTDAGYVALFSGSSSGLVTGTSTASQTWTGSATEYLGLAISAAGDVNGDGYDDVLLGAPGAGLTAGRATLHYGGLDADADGYLSNGSGFQLDCDDGNASVNLGATEACDTLDNDCDGDIDEPGADGESVWYGDGDGDGYGDATTSLTACDAPVGYVADSTDCDDTETSISPAATEACDGEDNDCDAAIDESGAVGESTWYADGDGDTYGDASVSTTSCDAPAGHVANDDDCDDAASGVNPGAVEVCDTFDNDCDGTVDGSSATGLGTWYMDADEDGYGDASVSTMSCEAPAGYVSNDDDCDDGDAGIRPSATEVCDAADTDEDCDGSADDSSAAGKSTWYADADSDSFGDASVSMAACDVPAGYVSNDDDCDDGASGVNPAATEICDAANTDEDCDGAADDSAAAGKSTWYADADGDAYGDAVVSTAACDLPAGYVSNDDDCDDDASGTNPGAAEICDAANTDEDCDGSADDSTASGKSTWYADADSDSFGDASVSAAACDLPSGYVGNDDDCDDTSSSVSPSATEICDASNTDEDCDGLADDGDSSATGENTWHRDADGDGYGSGTLSTRTCDVPTGYVANDDDCDDGDDGDYPGAAEAVGNSDDESCDGAEICYVDGDDDGYVTGSAATVASADADCTDSGEATSGDPSGDCDDDDASLNPGEAEVCDDIDNDCDGTVDDGLATSSWYADGDDDGYGDASGVTLDCAAPAGTVSNGLDCDDDDAGISPGATEVCDAADTDEDCDGLSDDDDSGATGKTAGYRDADDDGYGDAAATLDYCDLPADFVGNDDDCDDTDGGDYPGATEIVGNGDDESCDGLETCYVDDDEDGYRPDASSTVSSSDADCDDVGEALAGEPTADCDDADAAYNPGAAEDDCADPNDYNCDGATGYADDDGDGWAACEECDDGDASVNPDGVEWVGDAVDSDCDGAEICYADDDNDGYVDGTGGTLDSTDADCADDYEAGDADPDGDCDDADEGLNPGAAEICDGLDNDCDASTDEGVEPATWYTDADGDGYGDESTAESACEAPEGAAAVAGDCDDADADIHPGAFELCDADDVDEDCDGAADGADALGQSTWYADLDEDGFGDSAATTVSCDLPDGYVADATDCDDLDGADYPGATEAVGNADDEDCDGSELCYGDADDDGYLPGDGSTVVSLDADCSDTGEALDGEPAGDCADTDATYNPGATEDDCADPNDYNCDGSVGYSDGDADGWAACEECDDTDAMINPDAVEMAGDAVDSDCDGGEICYEDGDDDGYVDGAGETLSSDDVDCVDAFEATDADPDGDCDDADASANPGGVEIPDDGVDQDCDGEDATTPGDDTGEDTGDDTGDDTGTDDSGADDSGADDSGDPLPDDSGLVADDTAGGQDTDDGKYGGTCGCASNPQPGGLAGLLGGLLAVLTLRRRR